MIECLQQISQATVGSSNRCDFAPEKQVAYYTGVH